MPHGKPDFSRINAPVLGHFGTNDDYVSVEDAKALEQELQAAGVEAAFEFYEGAGHAFFGPPDRIGTYDAEHARTLGSGRSTSSSGTWAAEPRRPSVSPARSRA